MRTGLPFSRKVTSCSLTATGPYCAVGAYPTWEPRVTWVAVPERLCKVMASYLLGNENWVWRRISFCSDRELLGECPPKRTAMSTSFFESSSFDRCCQMLAIA